MVVLGWLFAYYPSLFWIINEYSKQTVYFSIVIHSRVTQDSLFFARAKINFRLLFFLLFPGSTGLSCFGRNCFQWYQFVRVSVETPELSHPCLRGFPGFFGDTIFFSFFSFFFQFFFQGGQDGQNPGIPENPGELDRLLKLMQNIAEILTL